METARAANALVSQLNSDFSRHQGPPKGRDLVQAARSFLEWREGAVGVPDRDEAADWYGELAARHGTSSAEKRFLSFRRAAAEIWGAPETAHLASVTRNVVGSNKPTRKSEWDAAALAISRLPTAWHDPFMRQLEASRTKDRKHCHPTIWSAAHLRSVASALRNWGNFCDTVGVDPVPTGATLERYARKIVAEGAAISTAADYLGRILSAFTAVIMPGFHTDGCRFVVDRWARRSRSAPPRTKTPRQVIPASAINALGFRLMDEAGAFPCYDLDAAINCRNGLLLAVATVLPQRARALSCFAFDTTFALLDGDRIQINISGTFLKLPEAQKPGTVYRVTFESIDLWQAANRYRRVFRPLFDDGNAVFPSARARGAFLTSGRIGQLVGDLTEKHLGKRVPVHRIRDCVATEATEQLLHGGRIAPALLGHGNAATTSRHYDHAEGHVATCRHGDFVAKRRGRRPSLLLDE